MYTVHVCFLGIKILSQGGKLLGGGDAKASGREPLFPIVKPLMGRDLYLTICNWSSVTLKFNELLKTWYSACILLDIPLLI